MEDKDMEYQEKIFTITSRQNRSAVSKTKQPKSKTIKTKYQLNPVMAVSKTDEIEGVKDSAESKKLDIAQEIVKDTLNVYKGTELPMIKKSNRLFLSECDFDDDDDETVIEDTSLFQTELKLQRRQKGKCSQKGRKGLERFRRIVEIIILTRQLFPCKKSVVLSNRDSILYFMDTDGKGEEIDSEKPHFDVNTFRSLRQKTMTAAVRQHLLVPSCERTDTQVNHLIHLLRAFSRFSRYPHVVQQNLCKQGWYARFESKRVLVKEGCRAEFYYMILSGIAIYRDVQSYFEEPDACPIPKNTSIASFLKAGDILGEKEILTNQERPATVVCKEPIEVLGVDRETLLDIFQAAGGLSSIEYLKTIPELTDFPLELLQTYHFSMSVHYYRRGAVIVKNSNESEWVYIVKSGSCQVYKAIRDIRKDDKETKAIRSEESKKEGTLGLPRIKHKYVSDDQKKTATDDIGVLSLNKGQKNFLTLERSKTSFPVLTPGKMPLVQSAQNDQLKYRMPKSQDYLQTSKEFFSWSQQHPKSSKGPKRKPVSSVSGQENKSKLLRRKTPRPETPDIIKSVKCGSLISASSDSKGSGINRMNSLSSESMGSIREEKDFNQSESVDHLVTTGTKESLFYVRLELICEKGVFGLHPLIYENMPNLSLVSNGAECVLVSKQFLKDQMDKSIAYKLRLKVPMYPNLGQLQTALGDQIAWDSYRGKVIHDVLK